jgi:hypothetical protein
MQAAKHHSKEPLSQAVPETADAEGCSAVCQLCRCILMLYYIESDYTEVQRPRQQSDCPLLEH